MPRAFHILVLFLCVGVFAAAFILDANDAGISLLGWTPPSTCSLYTTFHVRCATCGLTRAFTYAAHGNFAKATEMNAIWPVAVAAFFVEMVYRAFALIAWPALLPKRIRIGHGVFLGLAVAAILGHWVLYLLTLLR